MAKFHRILISSLAVSVSAVKVSPVEKVITLLEDLKTEVETEGTTEAGTYDKYACFCKDNTKTKSEAITEGQDTIDSLAADIAADTATKAEKSSDLMKKKAEVEELSIELEDVTSKCLKEEAEFEANLADLTKACNSLDKALKAMKAGKGAALLELNMNSTLQDEVAHTLAVAEALGMVEVPKSRAVTAFMQGKKADPADKEYKFHSDGIITTLEDLDKEFKAKKTETQKEMVKAKGLCDDSKKELTGQIETAEGEITTLEEDIDKLKTSIADNRGSLVEAEDALKDDKVYLKDLTMQCESSAVEWDQRSQSRAEEIKVLGEALAILKEGGDGKKSVQELEAASGPRGKGDDAKAGLVQVKAPAPKKAAPSFLQQASRSVSLRSTSARMQEAEDVLREAGIKLKSAALTALATNLRKDPFSKVKAMIQNLIERLLDEAKKEATKQGFCDTQLGKAYKDRDFRLEDAQKKSAEVGVLRSKNDTLGEDITELDEAIPELYKTLNETTDLRATEKEENLDRIKTAKEGEAAVTEAIVLLKTYYKQGTKVLLQTRESPVAEDLEKAGIDGPGFSGEYKGKGEGAKGIIGLLEVVKSDFERTVRQTTAEEKKAQEEFVKFEQATKSDISAKETSLELKTEDQKMVVSSMEKGLSDLETIQGLLDDALKTVEDLKPMCLDMAQSYEERKQKREDEIEALKKALEYLTPK